MNTGGKATPPPMPLPMAVPTPHAGMHAYLSVAYLSSYEGIGIATIHCYGGCTCEPAEIDGHRPPAVTSGGGSSGGGSGGGGGGGGGGKGGGPPRQQFVSLWLQHRLEARLQRGALSCVVRVLLHNRTSSGGTKFKLGGLSISWDPRQDANASVAGEGLGGREGSATLKGMRQARHNAPLWRILNSSS
eukprot:CAMPEP_0181185494 /NCGR_PEP_ID=MMETSP1096-20121128/9535_1 /TAXON_ID=156174 ORGANISM="Chrysochromulina ericina, Strain CCMP281" /NCGR_SAMPLE_ID=MMETSP1096 /ASSEMBLY_ACC=CAM_ASM_000453 /LENGTH=187 /DNA_ID=CAMNT_0023274337 /DNA_START=29 /DNA_END=593 /DNA_ORIENTATION=+